MSSVLEEEEGGEEDRLQGDEEGAHDGWSTREGRGRAKWGKWLCWFVVVVLTA